MAIMLTKTATERVRTFLDKDGGVGLRLGVRKTGCSGWAYTVQLAEDIQQDDIIFDNDGVKVVVDRESLGFLDGSEIDFVSEGLGMTFKFNNPNVTQSFTRSQPLGKSVYNFLIARMI